MGDRQWLREQINKLKIDGNFEIDLKQSRRRLLVVRKVRKGQDVFVLTEVIRKKGVITHRTAYDYYTDKEKLITEIITRSFQMVRGVKHGKNEAKRSAMYALR